jgi:exodeoxyribonuclease VII small subunit
MTKTYEELVTELRDVVRQLEDDRTGLDECIQLYERGAILVRLCEELLTTAEMKICELGRD